MLFKSIKTFPQLILFQRNVLSDWGILGEDKCRNQEVELPKLNNSVGKGLQIVNQIILRGRNENSKCNSEFGLSD